MSSWADNITAIIKSATDVLLLKHPFDTAMGILGGLIIQFLVILLSPFWELLNFLRSATNFLHYTAISVFLFNVKYFFPQYKMPTEVDEAFWRIQKWVDTGVITPYDARLLRLAVVRKVTENVTFNHQISGANLTETITKK